MEEDQNVQVDDVNNQPSQEHAGSPRSRGRSKSRLGGAGPELRKKLKMRLRQRYRSTSPSQPRFIDRDPEWKRVRTPSSDGRSSSSQTETRSRSSTESYQPPNKRQAGDPSNIAFIAECKAIHSSMSDVSTEYEESLLDDQDDDDMDWLAEQVYHVDDKMFDKDSRIDIAVIVVWDLLTLLKILQYKLC